MLSIFKKRSSPTVDYSALVTDMHSHLLPGIDDGSSNPRQSVELINALQDLGFKKFITTPHIIPHLYRNTPATIQAAFDLVKQEAGAGLPLKAAAEYFMDESLDALLRENKPLLCLYDNVVLVEFSFVTTDLNFKERLFNLQMSGYQPVLAHPERYVYLSSDKGIYDELKESGCRFACNLLSFTGYYGKAPALLANHLLKKDYIDYLGTDLHHFRHIDALRQAHTLMPIVKQLTDSGRLLNPRL